MGQFLGHRGNSYHDAVDSLVNTKLLHQFLNRQTDPASLPKKSTRRWRSSSRSSRPEGQDLATALAENEMPRSTRSARRRQPDPLVRVPQGQGHRRRAAEVPRRSPRPVQRHPWSGQPHPARRSSRMRAPPRRKRSSRSCRHQERDRGGTITFAAAANKYSEDPANSEAPGATSTTSRSTAASSRSSPTSPSR